MSKIKSENARTKVIFFLSLVRLENPPRASDAGKVVKIDRNFSSRMIELFSRSSLRHTKDVSNPESPYYSTERAELSKCVIIERC